MKHNRLQNKVAGSELTLPICAVVATALWWLPKGTFSVRSFLGLVLCMLTTYVIMETNARQHIIRIRTRMMSCVWLVLSACLSFMHPLEEPLIAAAFLCGSYMLLFQCYQRYRPQLTVFHVFLLLSIGSFFAPVMLLMAIPFYFYLIVFLRSLTTKAFWAGILGLVVPYWCYAILSILLFHTFTFSQFASHIISQFDFFTVPQFDHFTVHLADYSFVKLSSCAFIALLSIVSIIHYLRTKYDDKIRVRMILYIYVTQTLLLMLFLLLQPAHYQTTMALIIASASPLIAHFFALTGSILSNLFFILSLLLTVAMAVLNLWMTSFSIS